ncbi:MAG TPA: 3'-5' exonuclease [Sulfuricurvum sp.]|nr:MAG: DNA polymerase III subunit epsilon [Campylobacterales bacterium 16-40-21]OZA02253.1 MAG: DNA polymerase III subunit epsilon [Sulfuricurvum sp. 17-40-25]HQS67675.1 3'-5' exonuclease [Sulfuricurvum sp.]HQT37162.1 3'-5' exonuclease [Sulfuricurvum sp.]
MFEALIRSWKQRGLLDAQYEWLFDPYDGDEVVVFDTETTGLDTKKDAVLSIGAVRIKNDRILTSQSFEVFLKPSRQISVESIKIHHIRPCDLQQALEPLEGVKKFLEFIGNRPLVGYYLEFDMAMINRLIKPWLGIALPNKQIEVSGLYFDKKIALIPQGNVDLRFDTILRNLNIPMMGQHNALNDAIMTAMVYLKLKHTHKLH